MTFTMGSAAFSAVAVMVAFIALAPMSAQSRRVEPTGELKFDVASIRVNKSNAGTFGVGAQRGGRFVAVGATPMQMILWSFGLDPYLLFGLPEWATTERYDVMAAPNPDADTSLDAVRKMAQNLLADRFRLVVHQEVRSIPAFALVRRDQQATSRRRY